MSFTNVPSSAITRFARITGLIVIFEAARLLSPLWAQQKEDCYGGVFLTQDDFVHHRLTHQVNAEAKGYKINFSFPADLTLTLRIETPDTVYKFAPGSIYGYTDCNGIYRYYKGGKALNAQEDFYKIEQIDGMVLYSSQFVSGNEIFYSLDLTSDIQRLTMRNLKDDFKDFPEFIDDIKELKKNPDGLATRDEDGFLILEAYRKRTDVM